MPLDVLTTSNRAANVGTTVSATTSEAATARLMVTTSSLNNSEIKPPINKNGRTATRFVVVDATSADSSS